MPTHQLNPRTTVLLLVVIIVTALRLLTSSAEHSNLLFGLTPLGAMALFGGAYFKGNIKPFLFTLAPLFISSIILSFTLYADYRVGLLYPGWFWVHASFALMVLWGKLILKKVDIINVTMAVLAATITHWTIGNVGECLTANSNQGFFQLFGNRLIAGLSYELKFLFGTAVYSLLMFGIFELAQMKFSWLRINAPES